MRRIGHLGMLLLVVVVMLSISASSASGQVSPSRDTGRFIGTWRLISITSNGQADPGRGPHPTGLIYYDRAGHMAVQIMPDRARPTFAGPEPTPDEAKAAIAGYTAYFGTYTIDERARTVTHHRAGNLSPGQSIDVVRRYEFAPGDRLILRPVEGRNELTWERVK